MLLILIKSRTDICLSITEKSNSCPQTAENKNMNTIIEIFVEDFLDTGNGLLSKKYTSQQVDPSTLKPNSQKLEYKDEFTNISKNDDWILNSRTIKYLNNNQEEEVQKFVFEELSLLN